MYIEFTPEQLEAIRAFKQATSAEDTTWDAAYKDGWNAAIAHMVWWFSGGEIKYEDV